MSQVKFSPMQFKFTLYSSFVVKYNAKYLKNIAKYSFLYIYKFIQKIRTYNRKKVKNWDIMSRQSMHDLI